MTQSAHPSNRHNRHYFMCTKNTDERIIVYLTWSRKRECFLENLILGSEFTKLERIKRRTPSIINAWNSQITFKMEIKTKVTVSGNWQSTDKVKPKSPRANKNHRENLPSEARLRKKRSPRAPFQIGGASAKGPSHFFHRVFFFNKSCTSKVFLHPPPWRASPYTRPQWQKLQSPQNLDPFLLLKMPLEF